MEKSKELVKQAGILPDLQVFIQLPQGGVKSTGPHTVKIIDESVIMTTQWSTGQSVPTVRYIFEENGEKKQWDVEVKDKNKNLDYKIQKMATFEKDQSIVIEGKKKGMRNYTDIRLLGDVENSADDIPIINQDEDTYADQPKSFAEQLKEN